MNGIDNICMDRKKLDGLKKVLTSNDPITIVVGDRKERSDRQREVLSELGHYLHDDMEVPFGQIVVLLAEHVEANKAAITGDYLADYCKVKEHDVHAPLFTVGKMRNGMEMGVDPLVVGRKVIDIDGAVCGVVSGNNREEREEAARMISTVCSIPL